LKHTGHNCKIADMQTNNLTLQISLISIQQMFCH
jgi:hypothetical protein